jgi:hypothetical protein
MSVFFKLEMKNGLKDPLPTVSSHFPSGLPELSWYNLPKREKMYQYTPNGRKIDQMAIKYTNIFHCKTLLKLPKFGQKMCHLATLLPIQF